MWDHIVRPGESLWLISQRFKKNLNEIFRLNPQIRDKTKIYPGMVVHMPDPPPQGDVIVGPITYGSDRQNPPGYYEVDIDVITNDPRTQPQYIDTVCQAVGYGIYVGGFLIFVPQSVSPHPILVPEHMVWFGGTKSERVSDTIFDSRVEALKVAGGEQPMRVAYFWGAGGRVVAPTAFTINTTPTIVNTASYVVDELVKEVQEELVYVAISIVGAMVGGAILTRLMRARGVEPGSPPRMPQRRLEAGDSPAPARVEQESHGGFKARYGDDPKAFATFKAEGTGVDVDGIWRGAQPEGSGGKMLADAMQKAGISHPETIRFSSIMEDQPTLAQLKQGVPPAETVLGRTLSNTARELGGEPTTWEVGEYRGKTWIQAKILYPK